MVLYFRNVHLDLPKIFALFWTPVLSRHGEENLTSRKNHLVHLWPTSFIGANYIPPPPPTKCFPFAAARAVEVLKTWTVKCTTPWKGSAADDTHHGTWVSVWVWVWVVLPQEEIADILGLYALCVAAFGVKSNVADSSLEGMNWSNKKQLFFVEICEMKAIDWSVNARN